MFRLEEIGYLSLLLVIPVFYILLLNYQRQKNATWDKLGIAKTLQNSRLLKKDKFNFKFILFLIIAFFGILALTNPQYGKKKEKIKTQNVDVFIALDVSQSMLCTDIKPDRLSRAQIWIKQFLDRFHSERIGFISFAGSAYLHSPLTTDIPTINLMASMAGPKNIGTQGTAIADAIRLATKSFADEEGFHKVILLISDGEDHEGEAVDAAKQAAEKGITIFTIPVGTEQGAPVPNMNYGTNSYKTNEKGELITSKPNRQLMQEIADATQSELLEIQNGDASFDILKKRFALLSKKDVTYNSFSSYESYFQYLLFIAFGLLIFETITMRRKNE
jgi:Ca-activated chloride channel family protein